MFSKFKAGDKVIKGEYPAFRDEYTQERLYAGHYMVGQIRHKIAQSPFVRYQYRLFKYDSYNKRYEKVLSNIWHEEYHLSPLESCDPNDILKGMVK